jgi:hypothetical protein
MSVSVVQVMNSINTFNSSGSEEITVTFNSPVTLGNTVAVFVGLNGEQDATGIPSPVTDTLGNVFSNFNTYVGSFGLVGLNQAESPAQYGYPLFCLQSNVQSGVNSISIPLTVVISANAPKVVCCVTAIEIAGLGALPTVTLGSASFQGVYPGAVDDPLFGPSVITPAFLNGIAIAAIWDYIANGNGSISVPGAGGLAPNWTLDSPSSPDKFLINVPGEFGVNTQSVFIVEHLIYNVPEINSAYPGPFTPSLSNADSGIQWGSGVAVLAFGPTPPTNPPSTVNSGYAPSWEGQGSASLQFFIAAGIVVGASTGFDGGLFSVPANSTTYFWADASANVHSGSSLPNGVYSICRVVSGSVTTGSNGQTTNGIVSLADLRQ